MSIKSNNQVKFDKMLKEFNENINKLFEKAEFTSMLILDDLNSRVRWELVRN